MNNYEKLGAAVFAMAAVLAVATWLTAMPMVTKPGALPNGSLGHAVATACDPNRSGQFTGVDLERAITCRDLAAQESMALSTERVVWLSWAQLGVAIGGSVAVVWTVLVALNSLRLTQRTFEHQQTATRLELRPRFAKPVVEVSDLEDGRMSVDIQVYNEGKLAALKVRWAFSHAFSQWQASRASEVVNSIELPEPSNSALPPGRAIGRRVIIPKSTADSIRNGVASLEYAFVMSFDDTLGGKYKFTYSRVLTGPNLKKTRKLAIKRKKIPDFVSREV